MRSSPSVFGVVGIRTANGGAGSSWGVGQGGMIAPGGKPSAACYYLPNEPVNKTLDEREAPFLTDRQRRVHVSRAILAMADQKHLQTMNIYPKSNRHYCRLSSPPHSSHNLLF